MLLSASRCCNRQLMAFMGSFIFFSVGKEVSAQGNGQFGGLDKQKVVSTERGPRHLVLQDAELSQNMIHNAPFVLDFPSSLKNERRAQVTMGDWRPIGQDIDAHPSYHSAMSEDGHILAIGSTQDEADGIVQVHIYVWNDSTSSWDPSGEVIDGPLEEFSRLRSLSMSDDGKRVAVLVSDQPNPRRSRYYVQVYELDDDGWKQIGRNLFPRDRDDTSTSVFLSGNGERVAFISRSFEGGSDLIYATVFDWDAGTSSWNQIGEIVNQDTGSLVFCMSGNGLIVNLYNAVHRWTGSTWEKMGPSFEIPDFNQRSCAFSFDGSKLVVADPFTEGDIVDDGYDYDYAEREENIGEVKVLGWSGSWSVVAHFSGEDYGPDRYLGTEIALSKDGQTLAIGARRRQDIREVIVYQAGGTVDGTSILSESGASVFQVSMAGNGKVLSFGGHGYDPDNDIVKVRMYRFSQDEPPLDEIKIDIKPYKTNNRIKIGKQKKILVALFGNPTFNVYDVKKATVRFGPSKTKALRVKRKKDINNDGYKDMILEFEADDAGLSKGDTEACLSGKTKDGSDFVACDAVVVKIV